MKRRSFITSLIALPAALLPFLGKAEARWPRTRKPPVDIHDYYPNSPLWWHPIDGEMFSLKPVAINTITGISVHDGHKTHQLIWPSGKPVEAGELKEGSVFEVDPKRPWIVLSLDGIKYGECGQA